MGDRSSALLPTPLERSRTNCCSRTVTTANSSLTLLLLYSCVVLSTSFTYFPVKHTPLRRRPACCNTHLCKRLTLHLGAVRLLPKSNVRPLYRANRCCCCCWRVFLFSPHLAVHLTAVSGVIIDLNTGTQFLNWFLNWPLLAVSTQAVLPPVLIVYVNSFSTFQ